jgi:hypothetical protein
VADVCRRASTSFMGEVWIRWVGHSHTQVSSCNVRAVCCISMSTNLASCLPVQSQPIPQVVDIAKAAQQRGLKLAGM